MSCEVLSGGDEDQGQRHIRLDVGQLIGFLHHQHCLIPFPFRDSNISKLSFYHFLPVGVEFESVP